MKNIVRIVFKQTKPEKAKLSYQIIERVELTDLNFDYKLIYNWVVWNFVEIFLMKITQGKAPLRISHQILINIFWNADMKLCLTQKKVNRNIYIGDGIHYMFPLNGKEYVLFPCESGSSLYKKELGTDPINKDALFNTVEHNNKGIQKYGSPIIYTGMTN